MKNHTILWADDDQDDLMLIREILHDYDQSTTIIEAPNGQAALDYLWKAKQNKNFPCLIILDMNMPVMSGKETLSLIKEEEALTSIPVAIFTTSNSAVDKIFCEMYDVDMVTKPTEYMALKKVVLKLLNLCNSAKHSN